MTDTARPVEGAGPPARRTPPRPLPLLIPRRDRDRGVDLLDADLNRGHLITGSSGAGKSEVLGYLSYLDHLRNLPQIIFDPHGGVTDALLFRLAQCPAALQPRLWRRVRYVDMSGRGDTFVPWPLLWELPGESRKDVADRFLHTLKAIDPNLATASIQGWNRLYKVGLPTGMVLSALGRPLSDAFDLLRSPGSWVIRFEQALARHPDVLPAVRYFREEYGALKDALRMEQSSLFLAKLQGLFADPIAEDFFCTSPAGIDFNDVVERGLTVILDFRGETNPELRLTKTRFAYDMILAFVKNRGPGKHGAGLRLRIDEITELTNQASLDHDLFAKDLDHLFNVVQRQYALPVTAALQHLWQTSERTQQTLMSLGTLCFGSQSSMEIAAVIARHYGALSPTRVKRREPMYMMDADSHRPFIVDFRDVDYPMDEQEFLLARKLIALPSFHFVVKRRGATGLQRVSLAAYMGPPWHNEHPALLGHLRAELSRRTGVPRPARPSPKSVLPTRPARLVTMEDDDDIIADPIPR